MAQIAHFFSGRRGAGVLREAQRVGLLLPQLGMV